MTDYFKKIRSLLVDKVGVDPEEVSEDSYFFDDLNVSEIELMELFAELEDEYDIALEEEEKDEVESVGDLINLLIEHVE